MSFTVILVPAMRPPNPRARAATHSLCRHEPQERSNLSQQNQYQIIVKLSDQQFVSCSLISASGTSIHADSAFKVLQSVRSRGILPKTQAHIQNRKNSMREKGTSQPHLKPHGHSCSPMSPLLWPASGPRTEGGPRHHAGDGALPARKCPSLVSDVLLSHGLLRSTIGARGLNFRVRNGTGCTSPAMVADQRGAFGCKGPGLRPVPWGPHSAASPRTEGRTTATPESQGGRARPISTARLSASRRLHLLPINQVVYLGPYRREDSSRDWLPA